MDLLDAGITTGNYQQAQGENLVPENHYLGTAICCLVMLAIFLGIYATEADPQSLDAMTKWGYVSSNDIWISHRFWGLITSAFLHVDPVHLAFNIYWFWILGKSIESTFGIARWAGFVLLAAFVSSASQLAQGESTGIGASGIGYAFFGLLWQIRDYYPEVRQLLTNRLKFTFLIWLVFCLANPQIGNAAHIIGLLFGCSVGIALVASGFKARAAKAVFTLLLVLSIVVLFWCPWSFSWNANKGYLAYLSGDYDSSLQYYSNCKRLATSPEKVKWTVTNTIQAQEATHSLKATTPN